MTVLDLQQHAEALFNVLQDVTEKNAAGWLYSALQKENPIEEARKVARGVTPGCSCHVCSTDLIEQYDCEWKPEVFSWFLLVTDEHPTAN